MKKIFLLILVLSVCCAYPEKFKRSASSHPYGESLNIMKSGVNGSIIDTASTEKLFLHPLLQNRKAVVLTILGDFRKGKSFFLDYCLRYLYANYKSINFMENPLNQKTEWMGSPEEPLTGFSWKSGAGRDTTGIIFWSDVFLHTSETTGEDLAIYIVDSQGLFDSKTLPADNSRIFTLSTLMSSIQILNIKDNVHENQLQYLQLSTDFARLSAKDTLNSANKAFQHLLFLIRDWPHIDNHDFGLKGGHDYITEILNVDSSRTGELQSVREYIYDSFDEISAFLLPSPGKTVETGVNRKTKKKYDGRHSEMEAEFKEYLKTLIEWLLSSKNLKEKRINGKNLLCSEMKVYLETYFEKFASEKSPKAESIYEITVEKNIMILIEKTMEEYEENLLSRLDPVMENFTHVIENTHRLCKVSAEESFNAADKMGTSMHAVKFSEVLKQKLDKKFEELKKYALNDHQRFSEEKEKIEKQMKDKDEEEKNLLLSLKQTNEKIAKLVFTRRSMKPAEYEKSMANLKLLQENQEKKVEEYRRKKENKDLLDKILKMQEDGVERERKLRKEMTDNQNKLIKTLNDAADARENRLKERIAEMENNQPTSSLRDTWHGRFATGAVDFLTFGQVKLA